MDQVMQRNDMLESTLEKDGVFDRRQAVGLLLADRKDALVVTGLGSPSYDVFAAGDHDGNFYLWGAMGAAALLGMGLALAQPTRPVIVITGDGEQLMGLGGLATIAVSRPDNLSIVLLDNGHFGETGMQKSHAGLGIDLAIVTRAIGFPVAKTLRNEADLLQARSEFLARGNGPRFYRIPIHAENLPRALPARDGVYVKNRFRAHLGFQVS